MNIFEAITNLLKDVMNDDNLARLHVGEVMNAWTYLAMIGEVVCYVEIGLNMARDKELHQALQECQKNCDSEVSRLTAFMIKEGIPLPPTAEKKPQSSPSAVPMSVLLTDEEIANGLAAKTAAAIMTSAAGITTSVRNDVGLLWTTFQVEKMEFGSKLKAMMLPRGWLKVPPPYYPPGRPHTR